MRRCSSNPQRELPPIFHQPCDGEGIDCGGRPSGDFVEQIFDLPGARAERRKFEYRCAAVKSVCKMLEWREPSGVAGLYAPKQLEQKREFALSTVQEALPNRRQFLQQSSFPVEFTHGRIPPNIGV